MGFGPVPAGADVDDNRDEQAGSVLHHTDDQPGNLFDFMGGSFE
jgi:hypothetical protein